MLVGRPYLATVWRFGGFEAFEEVINDLCLLGPPIRPLYRYFGGSGTPAEVCSD